MYIVNSFDIENEKFYYYDLKKVFAENNSLRRLPVVLKILLESNLRKAKSETQTKKILETFRNRTGSKIGFYPSRIIMHEFSGIPALVDLASMRDEISKRGGDVSKINPQILVDMVIDQSIKLGKTDTSKEIDTQKEYELNKERYQFIKWAQNEFSNFRVVPPGSGVCHQVNLEFLSTILHVQKIEEKFFLYPETIIGTDSYTTMINSIGVLGWGAEGIEAESLMLGLPLYFKLPKVVGINIHGQLDDVVNSSDIVLTLIEVLKNSNIDGNLVEFYGEGLKYITLEDRSTIANLAPLYNARCSFFIIDDKTINYFNKTRDNDDYGKIVKEYLIRQKLFFENQRLDYDENINFDLSTLKPTIIALKKEPESVEINSLKNFEITKHSKTIKDGDIVFSAITSNESTTSPYLLIEAALVAKKAIDLGLKINKNIKTYFSTSSIVVKEYLEKLDLLKYLEHLGFYIVNIHNTISSSNNIDEVIEEQIKTNSLNVCSVSSGDRNITKKINPLIKSNYQMSPSLVVIYSLIGNIKFDIYKDVLGVLDDKDIYVRNLWPSNKEVLEYLGELDYSLYRKIYKDIFKGNEFWQGLNIQESKTYNWNENSTYIQATNIFDKVNLENIDIKEASILAIFDDDVTIEQISPFGQISLYSPAARYLESKGVKSFEYNTFNSRRGNSDVMVRGVFDNTTLKNKMVSKEGGFTKDFETNEIISIYERAMKEKNKPLVIFAGKNYGIGEIRDWTAKGTKLLGVKAIIAESFSEAYKTNLIELGILPLEFIDDNIDSLKLKGDEKITIQSVIIKENLKIKAILYKNDMQIELDLKSRIETAAEVDYYKKGGVLSYLLEKIIR